MITREISIFCCALKKRYSLRNHSNSTQSTIKFGFGTLVILDKATKPLKNGKILTATLKIKTSSICKWKLSITSAAPATSWLKVKNRQNTLMIVVARGEQWEEAYEK